MQSNPRRLKIIALSIALLFCAVTLVDTVVREKFGARPTPIRSDSLALLKTILIFASAYSLVAVLSLGYLRTALLNRFSARRSRLSPETTFLIMNYVLLVAPAFYGQLLYNSGISIREFWYFMGASVVMTLMWAIYDFRRT